MNDDQRILPPWQPFHKDAVMVEVIDGLLYTGKLIEATLGSSRIANDYIGFKVEDWSDADLKPRHRAQVDVDRFLVASQASGAYDYTFQTGNIMSRLYFHLDQWRDLEAFYLGAVRNALGDPTSTADRKSTLRHTLIAAHGRLRLSSGLAVTVSQMALLANLEDSTVRALLKAEGIEAKGTLEEVLAEVAEPWLRRQPNFRPTAIAGDIDELLESLAFADAVKNALEVREISVADLAIAVKVDVQWLEGVFEGRKVACDTDALQRIAVYFRGNVPQFVGRGVEWILSSCVNEAECFKVTLH